MQPDRELFECRNDAFYFLTHYVHTIDQADGNTKLFPEWDYIDEILAKISQPGDFFLEKSRDMMVSWTVMGFMLHHLVFFKDWAGFAISRKQDEVDDGGQNSTPESLFGRIRYMHARLPDWMRPQFDFSKLRIRNLETNSYVTGESANPNSGRNVACSFKFADEFAFLPKNDQVQINRSMRFGSYQTLLYVTTPDPNTFAEKISKQGKGFEKIQIHWSLHPDRDEEWFKEKTRGSSEDDIAAELNLSYEQKRDEFFVAKYWDEEKFCLPDSEIPSGQFKFLACGMDYGFVRTAIELAGMVDNVWYIFKEFYVHNVTASEVAELVQSLSRRHSFSTYLGADRPELVNELSRRSIINTPIQQNVSRRLSILVTLFKEQRIRVAESCTGILQEIPKYRRKKQKVIFLV